MGVLACCKKECENIMCKFYIPDVGYVCTDCTNEFKEYLKNKNKVELTNSEIKEELEKFINITKGGSENISIDTFFDRYER